MIPIDASLLLQTSLIEASYVKVRLEHLRCRHWTMMISFYQIDWYFSNSNNHHIANTLSFFIAFIFCSFFASSSSCLWFIAIIIDTLNNTINGTTNIYHIPSISLLSSNINNRQFFQSCFLLLSILHPHCTSAYISIEEFEVEIKVKTEQVHSH